jgi:hypothetical protein
MGASRALPARRGRPPPWQRCAARPSPSTTATARPHADARRRPRALYVPGSSGLHVHDHRTGARARRHHRATSAEYVRLSPTGCRISAYLATAFSTGDDVAPGISATPGACCSDVDPLAQAPRRHRSVHRARRAAHGRDAGSSSAAIRADLLRPAAGDLHDHGHGQLPLRRGLLPEPDRLRRGRHPGRDRARDADGPDRRP